MLFEQIISSWFALDVILTAEVLLILIVSIVSIWNAAIGPTGAITFASMAALLPPGAVVPIHAVVQLGSSVSRSVLLWRHVDWEFLFLFVLGGLGGFFLGYPIYEILTPDEDTLRILLGAAILFMVWIPLKNIPTVYGRNWPYFGGLTTSALTIFIGATGPLVTALIHPRSPDHRQVLGTSALCMIFQHSAKIIIFGSLGFSFYAYAPLILKLMLAGWLGTWIGSRILFQVSQEIIKPIFKVGVTAIAFYLLWLGLR